MAGWVFHVCAKPPRFCFLPKTLISLVHPSFPLFLPRFFPFGSFFRSADKLPSPPPVICCGYFFSTGYPWSFYCIFPFGTGSVLLLFQRFFFSSPPLASDLGVKLYQVGPLIMSASLFFTLTLDESERKSLFLVFEGSLAVALFVTARHGAPPPWLVFHW